MQISASFSNCLEYANVHPDASLCIHWKVAAASGGDLTQRVDALYRPPPHISWLSGGGFSENCCVFACARLVQASQCTTCTCM